jgi:PPOX class probable F420-dependent enzyme
MTALTIPDSHRDLLDGRYNAVLSTVMPDGQPQVTPVWFMVEDGAIFLNSMARFRKTKNMRRNPLVTLLIYNPANPLHNLEIRGRVVDMTEDRAHLDRMTQHYLGRDDARFFGDCVDAALVDQFTPVKIRIAPTRIRVEG